MVKILWFSCILICTSLFTYGQTENQVSVFDQTINPAGIIEELPPPPPKVEGSVYLSEEWQHGAVTLASNQKITNYLLKYDLQNHILEIRVSDEIKVCPLHMFTSFELKDVRTNTTSRFVNLPNLTNDPEFADGIAEVLFEGEVLLLKQYHLVTKEPTYLATVDMGKKNSSIHKKEKFYISQNKTLKKIERRHKLNKELFGNHQSQMETYIATNKLKFSNESDLINIALHFNSIISGK
ncbi:hypothetical protein FNH22_15445 [Fulvivirga sp. M361]|uniref:hypothetical protein n=1 Tax=Fulvivirga sp. M361 TaxID=2594266 RepID=UPI00117B01B4|nr:hypothetical protein [Fulvivirga sp. M361]TRX57537.1 hypothetical protein FNH22_15445 [Fulvivirga sp. M361]